MLVRSRFLRRCVSRQGVLRAAALVTLLPIVPRAVRAQGHVLAQFARVDAYADAVPRSAEQSVLALAAYLAKSGPTDLIRARALYRWVTRNIAYDVAGFVAGNYGDLTPDGVLRRRISVCEGYSRLTQVLGSAMGLQIAMIKGWSKGYSYTSGEKLNGPVNHAWNAVMIDGKWRLMDLTWGSGYLDEKMKFVRSFQEHYFLTSPEEFLFDHLPADPTWQFVDHAISNAEFADLVYVRPMFFEAGFSIVSNKHANISAADRTTITLGISQPVELIAEVLDAATEQPVRGEFAFVQANDERAEINVAFPRAGNYVVRLFAKHRGAEGPLDWVLDYAVKATRGSAQAAFPTPYVSFGRSGAWLLESPAGVMDVGKTYKISLRAPGVSEMMMVNGATRTPLTKAGNEFSAEVVAPPGESVLYAKFGSSEKYLGLLRYVAR